MEEQRVNISTLLKWLSAGGLVRDHAVACVAKGSDRIEYLRKLENHVFELEHLLFHMRRGPCEHLEQVEVDVKLLLILDKQYVHNLLFSGWSDSVNDGFTVVFHLFTYPWK